VSKERALNRMPTFDAQDSLATLSEVLLALPKQPEPASPLEKLLPHGESVSNRRIVAAVACAFLVVGIVVCAVIMSLPYANHLVWLWIAVPFCSAALALYLGTLLYVLVAIRQGASSELLERCLYFAAGCVTGPIALAVSLVWQLSHRNRYYIELLFITAGWGAWTVIVCSAFGTLLALEATGFSTVWNFVNSVGVSWLLFVCASLGLVVLLASVLRIWRHANSSVRITASFVEQFGWQFLRCLQETFAQPAGILLDIILALLIGVLVGVTTVGTWTPPVLEQIANITSGTPFPITDCPAFTP
jgi:hypothetical protein